MTIFLGVLVLIGVCVLIALRPRRAGATRDRGSSWSGGFWSGDGGSGCGGSDGGGGGGGDGGGGC